MPEILSEIKDTISMYGSDAISLYFEAPALCFTQQEIEELSQFRKTNNLKFTWRAETRVEYLTPDRIASLYNSGMRIVDIGMESGSKTILKNMNKTSNPSKYLENLAIALRALKRTKLLGKLNILFCLGENTTTLSETISYLDLNLNGQALSAYLLILIPGSRLSFMKEQIAKSGGTIISDKSWEDRHINPIDPSQDFTYKQLQDIGLLLQKTYQDEKTYFKNRVLGYFSPGTTFEEFLEYSNKFKSSEVPYSRSKKEMTQAKKKLLELLSATKNHS